MNPSGRLSPRPKSDALILHTTFSALTRLPGAVGGPSFTSARQALDTQLRGPSTPAVLYFFYMASKEVTLAELGAMLTHVVDQMAMKEDIAEVKDDIADIGIAMATKNDLASGLLRYQSYSRRPRRFTRCSWKSDGFPQGNCGMRRLAGRPDHAFDRIAAIERQA
jgi:hypothetical protein